MESARRARAVASAAIFPEREKKRRNGVAEKVCLYCLASRHISASQVTRGAALRARLVRASMIALILLIVECAGCFAAYAKMASRISVLIIESVLPDWTIMTSR